MFSRVILRVCDICNSTCWNRLNAVILHNIWLSSTILFYINWINFIIYAQHLTSFAITHVAWIQFHLEKKLKQYTHILYNCKTANNCSKTACVCVLDSWVKIGSIHKIWSTVFRSGGKCDDATRYEVHTLLVVGFVSIDVFVRKKTSLQYHTFIRILKRYFFFKHQYRTLTVTINYSPNYNDYVLAIF